MKRLGWIVLCAAVFVMTAAAQGQFKYVGVKMCSVCHKTEKQGKQFDIWSKSMHAQAYKTLLTDEANKIAKEKGLKKPAVESPECLQCHVITATNVEKSFDMKDGVQCETCHGPGSGYRSVAVMKDKAKAVAAGLKFYNNDKEIEALCVTCHNDKSPTKKAFNFKEMWPKIKHPVPKS